jgi:hypothetical protein
MGPGRGNVRNRKHRADNRQKPYAARVQQQRQLLNFQFAAEQSAAAISSKALPMA